MLVNVDVKPLRRVGLGGRKIQANPFREFSKESTVLDWPWHLLGEAKKMGRGNFTLVKVTGKFISRFQYIL